jgi:predicted N-acetyltransferase YhbS
MILSQSAFTVRPLSSEEEYTLYYRLADTAFSSQPSDEDARRWQHATMQHPDFRPEQIRGAFQDDQFVGGYIIDKHLLCMGAARIPTGCIGAVVTHPDHRKKGVASALMRDAIDFARRDGHALLLLDGIPNFYFRYGYIDMFDVTMVEIDRSAILAQPSTQYSVRAATVEDAPALLALYRRQFENVTGSLERSLEDQTYRLRYAQMPPVVALSPRGAIEGYLIHGRNEELAQGREVTAENWEALLALLHHHARLLNGDAASTSLQYFLPPDSLITQWLIDTLEVPDTSQWRHPSLEWGVRGMSYHHRFAGWMGRLTDFPLLMNASLPEFQARWRRSLARWTGEISLTVEGETRVLQFNDASLQLAESPASSAYRLELTPQALVQLLFGYRPLGQLTSIEHLPGDARAALAILFPLGHTWIPRTDWF